jgi:hypothetical protein
MRPTWLVNVHDTIWAARGGFSAKTPPRHTPSFHAIFDSLLQANESTLTTPRACVQYDSRYERHAKA